MWIVYAGLILLFFTSFVGKNNSVWKPIRYITFGILSILFLLIGLKWWIYTIAFSLAAGIAVIIYKEEHGKNIWTKLSGVILVIFITASAGIAIADYAITQSVAKADSRIAELQEAFSYDYSAEIEGFTYVENGFSTSEYPEPYIYFFVDDADFVDGDIKTLRNPRYSGMFLSDEKMAEINTAVVVVRRYGSGNTYDVYRNGVKTDSTKSIYQEVIDIYFINLQTHEYTYMLGVVSGQMPNKNGGGVTSVSRAKAFKTLRAIYD